MRLYSILTFFFLYEQLFVFGHFNLIIWFDWYFQVEIVLETFFFYTKLINSLNSLGQSGGKKYWNHIDHANKKKRSLLFAINLIYISKKNKKKKKKTVIFDIMRRFKHSIGARYWLTSYLIYLLILIKYTRCILIIISSMAYSVCILQYKLL